MSESTAKLNLSVGTGQSVPALGALIAQTGLLGGALQKAQKEIAATASALGTGGKDSLVSGLKDFAIGANQGIELLGKFATGVKSAFEKFDELTRFSAELNRLNTSIPTATLNQFRVATKGTVDDLTLLRTANVAMQGAFHLTAAGVNDVLRAATNLSQEGFGPTVEIFNKLDKAIRTQSVDSLKDFGISLENASTKAGTVTKILKALHEEANKKINVDPSVDALNKFESAVSNWWTGFKSDVGEVFGLIAQEILKATALINKNAAANDRADSAVETSRQNSYQAIAKKRGSSEEDVTAELASTQLLSQFGLIQGGTDNLTPEEALQYGVAGALSLQQSYANFRASDARALIKKDTDKLLEMLKQAKAKKTAGKLEEKPREFTLEQAFGADFGGPAGYDTGHGFNLFNNYQTPFGPQEKNVFGPGFLESGLNDLNQNGPGILTGSHSLGFLNPTAPDAGGDERGGFLQSGFKDFTDQLQKEESFMSELKDKTSVLGGAFGTLESGISAAVEAAIDGSDSIAKAFAKASSAALKSIAIESATRALYETALGFGDLAWGRPTAALHFKSAAVFTAAAVAAGVGAAALGALGGGSSSSAGSGGVPSGGGGPTSQANNNGPSVVNVYISGAVTAGDYAQLGETVTKAVKLGQQTGRVRSGDNVTVTWE